MKKEKEKIIIPVQATIVEVKEDERDGEKIALARVVVTDPAWPAPKGVPRLEVTVEIDPTMLNSQRVVNLAASEIVKRKLLEFTGLGLLVEFRRREQQRAAEEKALADIGRALLSNQLSMEQIAELKKSQEKVMNPETEPAAKSDQQSAKLEN